MHYCFPTRRVQEQMNSEEISEDVWKEVRKACADRGPEEQEKIAVAVVKLVLSRFSHDWEVIRRHPADEEEWLAMVDPMIDRYAHLISDIYSEIRELLEGEIVSELRDLSADMIMTANILHMMGVGEEYRLRVDDLIRRAQEITQKLAKERELSAPV
jgi:hypothetical protein